jgi:hypothetical protein
VLAMTPVRRKDGFIMTLHIRSFSRSLALTVLSATLAIPAFSASALADVAPAAPQAAEVPAAPTGARAGTPVNVVSEVSRYIVGPLGTVRGFMLKDGTAVMVHGTSGDAMAKEVAVGQSVRVEGFSPASSGGKEIRRAAVFGQHGQIVTPPARGDRQRDPSARKERWEEKRAEIAKLPDASANGTVQAVLAGRRGKPMGVVLTDGTSVFLRPSLARAVMARGIRIGDRIESSGKGASYPLGASVLVRSISFADGSHFEAPARSNAQPR